MYWFSLLLFSSKERQRKKNELFVQIPSSLIFKNLQQQQQHELTHMKSIWMVKWDFLWLFHSLAWCQYAWMFNGIYVNENKNSAMYTNPLSSLYVWCQPHTWHPLQQQQQFYLRFSLTHNFPRNFPSNVLLGAHTTKHEKNGSSKLFFAVLKKSNFFISSHVARNNDDDVDCEEIKAQKELKKFTLKLSFYALLPRCAIKIGESVIN